MGAFLVTHNAHTANGDSQQEPWLLYLSPSMYLALEFSQPWAYHAIRSSNKIFFFYATSVFGATPCCFHTKS